MTLTVPQTGDDALTTMQAVVNFLNSNELSDFNVPQGGWPANAIFITDSTGNLTTITSASDRVLGWSASGVPELKPAIALKDAEYLTGVRDVKLTSGSPTQRTITIPYGANNALALGSNTFTTARQVVSNTGASTIPVRIGSIASGNYKELTLPANESILLPLTNCRVYHNNAASGVVVQLLCWDVNTDRNKFYNQAYSTAWTSFLSGDNNSYILRASANAKLRKGTGSAFDYGPNGDTLHGTLVVDKDWQVQSVTNGSTHLYMEKI